MYFPFFKPKFSTEIPELLVDIHSHLIPNMDDGAKNIEESLNLLRALESMGYKKIITTPHIMMDTYPNTASKIKEGLKIISSKAKEAGINLQIEAAAEYYLDEGFLSHLDSGDILTLANKYILCETSYLEKPLFFDEIICKIVSAGYKPLLAHPERYRYIYDLKTEYRALKEKGIYFQVNLNSFGGHYGKEAKRKVNFLNKNGMIDFLGSDIHFMRQIETMKIIKDKNVYHTIFQNNTILNNELFTNS